MRNGNEACTKLKSDSSKGNNADDDSCHGTCNGNADDVSCGRTHYFNNIVGAESRLASLGNINKGCDYTDGNADCNSHEGSINCCASDAKEEYNCYQWKKHVSLAKEQWKKLWKLFPWKSLESKLVCFKVNRNENSCKVEKGRNDSSLDNLDVRHAQTFCHKECCGTHDWRHKLTTCRGCGFYCSCKFTLVTKFFHHRNCKASASYCI